MNLTFIMLFGAIHTVTPYIGSGNSMEPHFHAGDIEQVCTDYPFDKLQAGDIVARRESGLVAQWNFDQSRAGNPLIHRIVRKNIFGNWITHGDNNSCEDMGCLTKENFVGKVLN